MQIFVADVLLISQKSIAMIEAKAELERVVSKYQKETREIQKVFTQKGKILEQQEELLKSEEFNKNKEEFEKELREKQQEFYVQRQNLEKLQEKVEIIFSNNIREVIKNVSKVKAYGIVIDKSSILYCENAFDISNIIIEELNKRLKTINLEVDKK